MVTAVKSLSTLLCDPHLMKEAISFLHSLSISQTFCLSHLYLRAADKAGFSTAEVEDSPVVLLRQLYYAIRNQLGHPKTQRVISCPTQFFMT